MYPFFTATCAASAHRDKTFLCVREFRIKNDGNEYHIFPAQRDEYFSRDEHSTNAKHIKYRYKYHLVLLCNLSCNM